MQLDFRNWVFVLWILLHQLLIQSQAVDSPLLVLISTNGFLYVVANPTPSDTSQSTPTSSGDVASVASTPKPAQVQSSLSSITDTGARASVNGDSASSVITSFTSTTLGTWPTSITFISQSGSVTVVEIGFLTTSDGSSYVTNTQPQQSLISASGSGFGQVIITESGTSTTLSLSNLPTATPLSLPTGVQVESVSGAIVTYSPYYLSGYDNSKPIEVFATFGENINGKVTSEAGWWLIGAGGEIDPPGKEPWNKGGGRNECLLGPLFCHTGWIQVGGGLVIPGPDPGPIGPPGYPGGPVGGMNGEPGDDPHSNNEPHQSSFSSSASSEGTAQYYLVLEAGADQTPVDDALEELVPGMDSVQPDLAANVVDGGFYIGYNMTSDQARNFSSLSEVWLINTYTSGLYSFSDPASSTLFTTTAVLATYTGGPAYASSTGTTPAKIRRKPRREVSKLDPRFLSSDSPEKESAGSDGAEALNRTDNLHKREQGTELVWQVNSPADLSVIAWAPRTKFEDVDYVMEETKGQDTWVILMDTGVVWQHNVSSLVSRAFPKTSVFDKNPVR